MSASTPAPKFVDCFISSAQTLKRIDEFCAIDAKANDYQLIEAQAIMRMARIVIERLNK